MKDKGYPVVALKFKDHAQGGAPDSAKCKVWGLLVTEDADTYYIYQWCCDGQVVDAENNHISSILKDVVEEIWEFGMDTLD